MFFNVWTHGHYVTNVLVFPPNRTIIVCAINAPWNLHDSTVAQIGGIYDNLDQLYRLFGGLVVADSAFCKATHPFIIKSVQHNYMAASVILHLLFLQQEKSI